MPKLLHLSGKEVISIFRSLGFSIAGQKGSHVKLRREVHQSSQTLTIPNHKELDVGTLKAIYNQALRYVSEEEIRHHFYK